MIGKSYVTVETSLLYLEIVINVILGFSDSVQEMTSSVWCAILSAEEKYCDAEFNCTGVFYEVKFFM